MERVISQKILQSYFRKLERCTDLDVAIVGAGPSGLLCARDLAKAGKRVAIFERMLKPGGGMWGGGMLFNEIVLQTEVLPILAELGVNHSPVEQGMASADAVELAAALIYHTVHAGAVIFNAITIEDVIFKEDRVGGVVINWSPVLDQSLQVDPLMVSSKCVLDAGGHDAELTAEVARKAGIRLETETGDVMGERPMWAERGEKGTVESSGRVYPGLYVSGMAANAVHGAFRMGPIFGGMLLSGRKVAQLILEELG